MATISVSDSSQGWRIQQTDPCSDRGFLKDFDLVDNRIDAVRSPLTAHDLREPSRSSSFLSDMNASSQSSVSSTSSLDELAVGCSTASVIRSLLQEEGFHEPELLRDHAQHVESQFKATRLFESQPLIAGMLESLVMIQQKGGEAVFCTNAGADKVSRELCNSINADPRVVGSVIIASTADPQQKKMQFQFAKDKNTVVECTMTLLGKCHKGKFTIEKGHSILDRLNPVDGRGVHLIGNELVDALEANRLHARGLDMKFYLVNDNPLEHLLATLEALPEQSHEQQQILAEFREHGFDRLACVSVSDGHELMEHLLHHDLSEHLFLFDVHGSVIDQHGYFQHIIETLPSGIETQADKGMLQRCC